MIGHNVTVPLHWKNLGNRGESISADSYDNYLWENVGEWKVDWDYVSHNYTEAQATYVIRDSEAALMFMLRFGIK